VSAALRSRPFGSFVTKPVCSPFPPPVLSFIPNTAFDGLLPAITSLKLLMSIASVSPRPCPAEATVLIISPPLLLCSMSPPQ